VRTVLRAAAALPRCTAPLGALFLAALAFAPAVRADDVLRWVDPFIGTDGTGHVFPGATRPFGMVAPSPDNADRGWSYASGYQFRAARILGFSNTHVSGAGIPELGDVLLQPAAGVPWNERTADFSAVKGDEQARPGYYAVRLPAHGVRVELTATRRVAVHRYTFDRDGRAQVLVDLQHGLHYQRTDRVLDAASQVDASAATVRGTTTSEAWVVRQASFVVQFDRPIVAATVLPPRAGERAARHLLTFDLGPSRVLVARVALSTVDEAGAVANLREADGLDFERIRRDAAREWRELLGRARIDAPARQKRIFYTALYHALVHPSDIADRDGRVRGPRGEVLAAAGGHYYSTMSLWDTFRAAHPLYTLLVPERVGGFVQSMLDHHRQQGYLPLWPVWGRETHTMIGNPALPVIAEAVVKGFGGFDRREALAAMVATSTRARPGAPEWAQREWSTYERYGYLPFDLEPGESVSKTLEYGYGDDAVARVACALGDEATCRCFAERARGYRLLFDPETRTMRGRDAQGRWRTPFDPTIATSPLNNPGDYTEANAWQYTLTPALHDPAGLVALLGGRRAFEAWLDRYFTLPMPAADKHLGQEALIGQNAHGNEPGHHAAWLYAYTDAPWKGEDLVRRIATEFYDDGPHGIVGNDDAGQMSAWYAFATLGFYPVAPASGAYVVASPGVRRVTLDVPGRPRLTIQVRGPLGAAGRTADVRLDGRRVERTALLHADLVRGGTLEFVRVAR
jgi:predicted alpha-1,2-mannosidase